MLKEVGASGQISLGKKYAGKLFDLQTEADGRIVMRPGKVVPVTPTTQEEPARCVAEAPAVGSSDAWLTPERRARRARRAAAAARSPAEFNAAREQWEVENKDAIEAMNRRMQKIGSMARRLHDWRHERDRALKPTQPHLQTRRWRHALAPPPPRRTDGAI